ncbi:hypothetical protein AAMO2058_001438300 [Amorphochlora amoebiformis]
MDWDEVEERAEEVSRQQRDKLGKKDPNAPKFTQSRINTLRRQGLLPRITQKPKDKISQGIGKDPLAVRPKGETEAMMARGRELDEIEKRKLLAQRDRRGPGPEVRDDWREEERISIRRKREEHERSLMGDPDVGKPYVPGALGHEDKAYVEHLLDMEKRKEMEEASEQDIKVQGMLRARAYIDKHGFEAYRQQIASGRDFMDNAKEYEISRLERVGRLRRRQQDLSYFPKNLTKDHRGFPLHPSETLSAEHVTFVHHPDFLLVPARRFPGKPHLNQGTPDAPGIKIVLNCPRHHNITTPVIEEEDFWENDGSFQGTFPGFMKRYKAWREERLKNDTKPHHRNKDIDLYNPVPKLSPDRRGALALRDVLESKDHALVQSGKIARDRRRVLRALGIADQLGVRTPDTSEERSELHLESSDRELLQPLNLGLPLSEENTQRPQTSTQLKSLESTKSSLNIDPNTLLEDASVGIESSGSHIFQQARADIEMGKARKIKGSV